MAAITFVKGATTWQPSRNPLYPGVRVISRPQVRGVTDGDLMYVYDKGAEHRVFELQFRLEETDKDNLLSFIQTDIVYGRETFTYNDEDAAAHTVRLVRVDVRTEEIANAIFDVALTLREEL